MRKSSVLNVPTSAVKKGPLTVAADDFFTTNQTLSRLNLSWRRHAKPEGTTSFSYPSSTANLIS